MICDKRDGKVWRWFFSLCTQTSIGLIHHSRTAMGMRRFSPAVHRIRATTLIHYVQLWRFSGLFLMNFLSTQLRFFSLDPCSGIYGANKYLARNLVGDFRSLGKFIMCFWSYFSVKFKKRLITTFLKFSEELSAIWLGSGSFMIHL